MATIQINVTYPLSFDNTQKYSAFIGDIPPSISDNLVKKHNSIVFLSKFPNEVKNFIETLPFVQDLSYVGPTLQIEFQSHSSNPSIIIDPPKTCATGT